MSPPAAKRARRPFQICLREQHEQRRGCCRKRVACARAQPEHRLARSEHECRPQQHPAQSDAEQLFPKPRAELHFSKKHAGFHIQHAEREPAAGGQKQPRARDPQAVPVREHAVQVHHREREPHCVGIFRKQQDRAAEFRIWRRWRAGHEAQFPAPHGHNPHHGEPCGPQEEYAPEHRDERFEGARDERAWHRATVADRAARRKMLVAPAVAKVT